MLVFNSAHFDHMTGADRPLQLEVAGLFRSQAAAWGAVDEATPGWREAVHTMKGSARGIGLDALAAACEAAETAAPDALTGALTLVRARLGEALAALDHFAADAA